MRGKWILLKLLTDESVQIDSFDGRHSIVGGRSLRYRL